MVVISFGVEIMVMPMCRGPREVRNVSVVFEPGVIEPIGVVMLGRLVHPDRKCAYPWRQPSQQDGCCDQTMEWATHAGKSRIGSSSMQRVGEKRSGKRRRESIGDDDSMKVAQAAAAVVVQLSIAIAGYRCGSKIRSSEPKCAQP